MPKKKKGKGKADEGNEDGGAMSDAQQATMYRELNQALVVQMADRAQEATRALVAKRELQERVAQLERDFEAEHVGTFEITQDMTRQYKSMQEELLGRVNSLENVIADLKDQLDASQVRLDDTVREKDQVIATKDLEIAELKNKMEEMSAEFGEMLKETLEKMKDSVEVTSSTFKNDTGVPVIRRLEEFNIASAYGAEAKK